MSCNQSRPQDVTAQGSDPAQGGHIKAPLRRFFSDLQQSALGAAVGRSLTVGIAMLGLAAIGTVSISRGATASGAAVAMAGAAKLASVAVPSLTAAAGSASMQKASEHNEPTTTPSPAPTDSDPPQMPEEGVTADGRIVLNTANATQLDRLPSVGPKRAEQIVALRTRLGRFKSLNELLRIRGIGKKTLAKMLPLLVLDQPKSAASPPAPDAKGGSGVKAPTP